MRTLRLLAIVWCSAAMQTAAVIGDVLGKQELAVQAQDAMERRARAEARKAQREPNPKAPWFEELEQWKVDE